VFFGEYLSNAEGEDVVSGNIDIIIIVIAIPLLSFSLLSSFLWFLSFTNYLHCRPNHSFHYYHYLILSGVRSPVSVEEIKNDLPDVYSTLLTIQNQLERHYRNMQVRVRVKDRERERIVSRVMLISTVVGAFVRTLTLTLFLILTLTLRTLSSLWKMANYISYRHVRASVQLEPGTFNPNPVPILTLTQPRP
jgi:hypothetical protein